MSIKFAAAGDGAYFDIVAETDTVTKKFLDQLIDEIENALGGPPRRFTKILLEVVASGIYLSVFEAFEVWRRASEKGLRLTQIAYVVSGRPISPVATFVETVAQNRGVMLRFFTSRESALGWLTASASAAGRTA